MLREPAIVYLHGRHNGVLQMHPPVQLQRQADLLRPVVARVKLRGGPWILAGYSGESDPLLEALCQGGCPAGLFWVNRSPPQGDALRPLRAAGACVLHGDADTVLLALAQRLAGGGRAGLVLPALLQPLLTFAELPPPPRTPAPDLPAPARVRRALAQALKRPGDTPLRGSSPAEASDRVVAAAAAAAIARAELLLQRARQDTGRPAAALTAPAEAAFAAAPAALPSRRRALSIWDRRLVDASHDGEAGRACWRAA